MGDRGEEGEEEEEEAELGVSLGVLGGEGCDEGLLLWKGEGKAC